MSHLPGDQNEMSPRQRAKSSLILLAFGLSLLAFLVAIERQNWFVLKPATGTARAMSYATDRAIPQHRS